MVQRGDVLVKFHCSNCVHLLYPEENNPTVTITWTKGLQHSAKNMQTCSFAFTLVTVH